VGVVNLVGHEAPFAVVDLAQWHLDCADISIENQFPLENPSMAKHILAFSLVCGVLLIADQTVAPAQTAPSAARADTLGNIQAAVSRAIGAQVKTVEVTTNGDVLVVARVNSNMNASTHEGRNNEAKEIASIVARSIGDKSKFRTVSTIRVDYMIRATITPTSKVVDSVEFRKGPDGVFDFHQT
jgi:hypothetical protein